MESMLQYSDIMANIRKDKKAEKSLQLYNEGFSLADIANKFECTRQSIHSLISSRDGYNPRKRTPARSQYFNGRKYTERANGYFLSTIKPRQLMHRDIWEFYNDLIPDNHDVHHKDHNRANNNKENLELMSKQEHARRFSSGSNQYKKKPKKW